MHRVWMMALFCIACSPTAERLAPKPEQQQAQQKDTADASIATMLASVDQARILADVEKLASFGTRHSLSDTKSDTRGIGAARRWLKRRFEAIGGRVQVRFEDFTAPAGKRVPKDWPMKNVVAVLPGKSARTIIVSGHYDSRATDAMDATIDAPGANDDASGVAVVLEACRVMAAQQFEATIMFAAVSGEEQGLFGSKAMSQALQERNVEVMAMVTNDIVGNSVSAAGKSDKKQVRVFSPGLPPPGPLRDTLLNVSEADSASRQLARAVKEAAGHVEGFDAMLVARLDRYLRGGDHRPFHRAGVPAVRLTEVHENFERQHQDVRGERHGDTMAAVDAAYMANVARLNIAALATLAWAPPAPDPVRLDVRSLAENSTVLWQPRPDERYELLARPTMAHTWTQVHDAGASGSFTVKLSKDHWHFGLRAVSPAGHASIAVFPLPLRRGEAWPPPKTP